VDLAAALLERVQAPTLLIVGGEDSEVLELNRRAYPTIGATQRSLEVIAGATHLFEEPDALERVCSLAGDWFERGFAASSPSPRAHPT
jgi:pimeloyl-ACP methyl ester carboxylesterase